MATFPTAVTQAPPQGQVQQGLGPGGPSQQGSPAIKLAMLGQVIQGLAQQFPQAQQGIKMMLDGLKMVQTSASSSSASQQPSAPPR